MMQMMNKSGRALLGALMLMGVFTVAAHAAIPANLTNWYKAENNAADSVGSRPGTLANGAGFTTGEVGNAFSLDGINDTVTLGSFPAIAGNPGFTVEGWIKVDPSAGNGLQAIFSATTTNFVHFQVSGGNDNIAVYTSSGQMLLPVIPTAPLNVWRHVALCVASGNTRLYINGVQNGATNTTGFATITAASDVRIGSGFGGGRFFKGAIDELSLYNRALLASEVESIYNAGSAGKFLPVDISVNDVTANEGNSGTTNFTFTVTRGGDTTNAINFNYSTSDGTATAGSDYVGVINGSGTIAAGAPSGTFTISVNGDTGFEPNETFTVTLSNPSANATLSDAQGIGTILNDESIGAKGGKIVFYSRRDGNYEIYVMNADGSNQTRLTTNSADDLYPSFSPDGSKIAFFSLRDGNYEIYVMNADGSNQTRLTNNSAVDWYPSFSPDGSKIAFMSNRNGNYEIYVMNADGSNQTRLTNNSADDSQPSFSPDGSKIAFTADRDGNSEIYVMNADGSNQTRLTTNSASDAFPSFSPDGSKIAFFSQRAGNGEIYVMNADGSNQTNLTNNNSFDSKPSFSPDGAKIAFASQRDGRVEIYVMNADGSNVTRLTTNSVESYSPSWAPGEVVAPALSINDVSANEGTSGTTDFTFTVTRTGFTTGTSSVSYATSNGTASAGSDYVATTGTLTFNAGEASKDITVTVNGDTTYEPNETFFVTLSNPTNATITTATGKGTILNDESVGAKGGKIAFTSGRDGNNEIYVMNADGSNQTRLTNNSANDYVPAFSADGSKIAFASDRDGDLEIYVMNADGSSQIRLTNNSGIDYVPSFSPDGAKIAFTSTRDGGNYEIYVMNADGSNQTRLTNNSALDYYPSFSPDGSKIAFTAERDGNGEIYVMNADGSNQTNLTRNSAFDYYPAFSPDGAKIAFTSYRNGSQAIYVMNADGSNPINLTNNSTSNFYPAFSPDGSKIAFTSTRDGGNSEIYVMNADGSNQIRLTTNGTFNEWPSWAPGEVANPNSAPVIATNTGLSATQGASAIITEEMLKATDADNDTPLTYTVTTAPTKGTLKRNGVTTNIFTQADIAANKVTYSQDGAFAPTDGFAFSVSDGNGGSVAGNFAITITEAPSLIVNISQDITANDGFTSLREAIAYANRKVGADTILFAIPTPRGAGVQTIQLASALPTLSGNGAATTIDGYSQAGASANTLTSGSDAVILIEVRGSGVAAFDGLTINAANCVVKGLSIGNCRYGINLESSEAHDTTISGNFIGLQADGSTASANDYGISIDHAASNTIGGATAAARNVIGSNNAEGIVSTGDNGIISGNYIGTNAAGSNARANRSGVLISVGAGNIISGNLLSGNTQNGIAIYGSGAGSAANNSVRGNTIGLSATGGALGNGTGVSILDASASSIGGVGGGEANIISGNSGKGVIVRGNLAAGNSVRGNSIYANGGLGIDLNDDGVSANDLGDGDSGPNGLQNFPVLTALSSNGGGGISGASSNISGGNSSSIAGTLNSKPNQIFSIDLYDNAAADASGYGEGQTYLGTTKASTDGSGNASFIATLTGVSLANGRVISATATDAAGNSSEFSLARTFDSNNAPVAVNGPVSVDEDDIVQIKLSASDADNDALTYSIVSNPAHGTLSAVDGNKVTYTPTENYNGADSFTFKANDGKADSNVATVNITINIVSDAPVAVDDSYIAQAGKTLTVEAPGVLGNDTNVDTDTVTVGSYTQPNNGSVSLNTDGSFVYTPDLGFHGSDSFTYRSTDSHLESNTATVTIVVQLVQVSSFSPAGGAPGTVVTVNGSNFVGVDDVQLNGQSASFNVVSSRKLTFTVPAGATSGKISVLAGVDNVSSAKEFVVAPRNITFTPSSGVASDVITISGVNLGDSRTTVKFSGATAPVNALIETRSATALTVVVPNTAVSGPISVSNIGGTASSTGSFVVKPSISSFTPSAGGFKTLVKVYGKGLGGATAVLLNGVNVGGFTQVSDTQVTFSVPAGATTGKITVVTPSGMAVSAINFSVYPK